MYAGLELDCQLACDHMGAYYTFVIRIFDYKNIQLLETEVVEIPLHDPVLWVQALNKDG